MRKTWWISLTILESALALGFGLAGPSKAQEGHDHAAATRGGAQAQTKRYHFDATFSRTGLKLTVQGLDHKPVDVSGLSVKATFYHPSTTKPWFSRALRPSPASQGQIPTSLELAMNLSKVPAKGAGSPSRSRVCLIRASRPRPSPSPSPWETTARSRLAGCRKPMRRRSQRSRFA